MKIEVLYVPGCPSRSAAVKLVEKVISTEGVEADIREVVVEDEEMARDLRFTGSPTIRINGEDVAAEPQANQNYAMSCRLYYGSEQIGVPPADQVRQAVHRARERGRL